MIGSTAFLLEIHHLKLEYGAFLPDEDSDIARPVCVLGSKIYHELFGRNAALGEVIRLGGFRCRVIGILGSEGRSLGLDTQELVVVPVAFAQMLFNTNGLFRILVEAKNLLILDRMREHISQVITKRHYGEEDFTIITQGAALFVAFPGSTSFLEKRMGSY